MGVISKIKSVQPRIKFNPPDSMLSLKHRTSITLYPMKLHAERNFVVNLLLANQSGSAVENREWLDHSGGLINGGPAA